MLQSRWVLWSVALGFALGGFFDGILLHQILQWHHLLSLVPGVDDLRLQVLWDGYFHALMYLLAAVALWGLWRAHGSAEAPWGRRLAGALLTGFGAWHVVDSILSHWVLGIHRIKLDSPNPLLWDIIWFVGFGLIPVAIGWLLLRRPPPRGARGFGSAAAVLALMGGTGLAAAWSLRPPPDQPFTTVVFGSDVGPRHAIAALAAADARLVWGDPAAGVLVVQLPQTGAWDLYRKGALLVSGGGLPAGCLDWSRL
ncbi:MAG: DUF2243 domain-containing protein [Pseudomonadota bacterium]